MLMVNPMGMEYVLALFVKEFCIIVCPDTLNIGIELSFAAQNEFLNHNVNIQFII